jgi:RNA polymerase sigma-B factor
VSDPCPELREQLIEQYRPLAMALLQRFRRHPDEDMEQVALLALIKAIDRFDPARGHCFPTFAVPTIQGELKRYLRDQSRLVRCPRSLLDLRDAVFARKRALTQTTGSSPTLAEIAADLEVELDQVVEAMAVDETCHPCSLDGLVPSRTQNQLVALEEFLGTEDAELQKTEERIAWTQALAELTPRLEQVMKLRYYENLSQQEAARRLGVSQMQVSRLERRALEYLRSQVATR